MKIHRLNTLKEDQIIEFSIKHRDFFINNISRNYPLSDRLIEEHFDKLNWGELKQNKNLSWSIHLLKKFENRWDWDGSFYSISASSSIPWSIELIEIFKDKWNWGQHGLSKNESLPWSIELLKKFDGNLDWEQLSTNKALPWSKELIELFKDKWSWSETSDVDNWGKSYDGGLSANESLPWTIELIKKYEDRWNWICLSENKGLPWSIELIEIFKDKWKWKYIIKMGLPREIIEKLKDKVGLDFPYFNQNVLNKLIEKNSDDEYYANPLERRLMFEDLWAGKIEKQNWNTDLIIQFEDRWDWFFLSQNENLPWTIELIKKYEDKWDWKCLSWNENLPWSNELIAIFENKWDWGRLCYNEQLPWSLKLIEVLKKNISDPNDDPIISQPLQWEKIFKPNLNDTIIDNLLKEYKSQE